MLQNTVRTSCIRGASWKVLFRGAASWQRGVNGVEQRLEHRRHLTGEPAAAAPNVRSRRSVGPSQQKPPTWLSKRHPSRTKTTELQPDGTYEHISLSKSELPNDSGTLATITICDPEKLNILTRDTLAELQRALRSISYDDAVRMVIFTGQSSPSKTASFCAGADIREMEALHSPIAAKSFIRRIYHICQAATLPNVVTIARIDGLCFGAGLELAACCDFRYGTDRSTFSMKEVAVGIPSVVHARLLGNIMGLQAAKRMTLLGKVMDADEARQSNLLDGKFATVEEMDQQIQEDVHLMASYGRRAVAAQKRLNHSWERMGLEEGLHVGINRFADMWDDGGIEPKRYMKAWMERSRDKKSE